jgi:hypothetical protein
MRRMVRDNRESRSTHHDTRPPIPQGNAEVILTARHYAAHAGDARALFNSSAERFLCYTAAAGGALKLAGASHVGVDDSACGRSPATLLDAARYPDRWGGWAHRDERAVAAAECEAFEQCYATSEVALLPAVLTATTRVPSAV